MRNGKITLTDNIHPNKQVGVWSHLSFRHPDPGLAAGAAEGMAERYGDRSVCTRRVRSGPDLEQWRADAHDGPLKTRQALCGVVRYAGHDVELMTKPGGEYTFDGQLSPIE
jgi:hypothetical protein